MTPSQQPPQRPRFREIGYLALLCAVAIAFCAALHWRDMNYPACGICDAVGYGGDAKGVQKNGIFQKMPSRAKRTYGYPLFLSLIMSPHALELPMSGYFVANVAIVQTLLYLLACLSLFYVLRSVNETAAWSSIVGLLFNPFILNYVPLRLTEGLTASLGVALVTIVCVLCLCIITRWQTLVLILAGSFIAGYALVVRPANVVLTAAWVVFLTFYLWRTERARVCVAPITCAVLGLGIPVGAQVAANMLIFGIMTPFPALGVGEFQLVHGLRTLKFAANLSGIGNQAAYYPNPFFEQHELELYGVGIYFYRPFQGALTVLFHLFNSIDHDHYFTYIYVLRPWYGIATNAINHVILYAAAIGGGGFLIARVKSWSTLRFELSNGVTIFLASVVAGTCAINSVSIVETRYGLLIYCVAGPLAVYGLSRLVTATTRRKVMAVCGCLIYVTIALCISGWMLNQGFPRNSLVELEKMRDTRAACIGQRV